MDEQFVVAVKLTAPSSHAFGIDPRRTLLVCNSFDAYSSLDLADRFSRADATSKRDELTNALMVDDARVLSVSEAEGILAQDRKSVV